MTSKINFSFYTQVHSDKQSSGNASLNNFKWQRDINGVDVRESKSENIQLPRSELVDVFNGLDLNNYGSTSTTYDLEKLSSGYRILHNSGTHPSFRIRRAIGIDGTSGVYIVKNGDMMEITVSSGKPINTATCIVGDRIKIGAPFNYSNRGVFEISAVKSNGFVVENKLCVDEALEPTSPTKDSFDVYSAQGVQVGDFVEINSGFYDSSHGKFEITDVNPDYIHFHSNKNLANQTNISSELILYKEIQKFIYIESDSNITLILNDKEIELETLYSGAGKNQCIFSFTGFIVSLSLIAKQNSANVTYIIAK